MYTPQILSVLQAEGVPATFFVIGKNAQQSPSYVQQEHADGEVIGDHTWDHPDLTTLSSDQVKSELQSAAGEIASLTGTPPTVWRPPYGATNDSVNQIASSLGLSLRLWNIDSQDWTMPGTDAIVSNVVNNVSPNAIIEMHDGSPDLSGDRSQTVAALPRIIDTLRARGYEFGTLSGTSGPTGPNVAVSGE
jgi:peptidoglycan-N-acetylglucosamine deacetylase